MVQELDMGLEAAQLAVNLLFWEAFFQGSWQDALCKHFRSVRCCALGCVALSWGLPYLIPKMNKLVVQGESPNALSG